MERSIALVALFAALIVALAFVPSLQLGFGVPVSAQTLGIMLCGTVLGAKRGTLAVLLFLLLVAIGLPVLSGGRGGLGVFMGPTIGYLVGFPLGAFVTGLIVQRFANPMGFVPALVGAVLGGVVLVDVLGMLGMMWRLDMTLAEAAAAGLVFLPGDLLKAVIAAFVTQALVKARPALAALHQ